MRREKYKGHIAAGVTAFTVVAASLLLYFCFAHLSTIIAFFDSVFRILRPVLYGLVLAFLLLPIQRHVDTFLCAITADKQLQDKRNRNFIRFISIVLSLIFAAFAIYVLLAMVLPQVYFSIVGFLQALPGYIRDLQKWITEFLAENPEVEQTVLPYYNTVAASVQEWLQKDIFPNLTTMDSTISWLQKSILPSLTTVATNLSSMAIALLVLLKDLLIAIIVSVYLLVRKDTLAAQAKKIVYSSLPTKIGDFLVEETRNAYRILSGFINGKIVDSLIIGIICLVCCKIFKFPYPALVATVVGITNVIPFFGPFIGAIPCAILILLVNPIQCVYFVIFILVLQQFDGNILGPMILGDSTGLDAFWVLFSILLFGGLFGFPGMVLGVPVFAMFYSIVKRMVYFGLRKKGLPVDTEVYIGKTEPFSEEKLDF